MLRRCPEYTLYCVPSLNFNFRIFASQHYQIFVTVLNSKHKIKPKCSLSPLCCIIFQQSTSQRAVLSPADLYQKARAVITCAPPEQYIFSLHPLPLFGLSFFLVIVGSFSLQTINPASATVCPTCGRTLAQAVRVPSHLVQWTMVTATVLTQFLIVT
jgi:hypothetical protein